MKPSLISRIVLEGNLYKLNKFDSEIYAELRERSIMDFEGYHYLCCCFIQDRGQYMYSVDCINF